MAAEAAAMARRTGGFDWRKWRVPLAAAATTAGALLVIPAAGVVLGLGWFLFLAARYDNHTGSCLMVSILAVIVVVVLALLVALAALPS
jgi:heme/copper-type cytochrome/quinol oxidase subunit 4